MTVEVAHVRLGEVPQQQDKGGPAQQSGPRKPVALLPVVKESRKRDHKIDSGRVSRSERFQPGILWRLWIPSAIGMRNLLFKLRDAPPCVVNIHPQLVEL